ncbi:MAG: hypothetical protein H0T92_20120 [Pyrinomonadaceae bacterium]|nr:hypothetical protein [Pyrinomonadaceae bacterium]
MTCSRSFGELIKSLEEMKEAVAMYMTKAAERLRNERLAASIVTAFIETSQFNPEEDRYANSATHELRYTTNINELLIGDMDKPITC